jgi:predicted amidohydrolase
MPMIVAGLQMDLRWEAPEDNLERAEVFLTRAAAAGARLVLLPETFATGFTLESTRAAQAAARIREHLSSAAQRHGLWIAAGFAEPGPERPFNAAAIFDPEGHEALHTRKLHLFSFAGEDERYAAGDRLHRLTVDGLRIAVHICYDLRFPEPFRLQAADVDLFLVPANWPAVRDHAWTTLLAARAMDTQAFVLGVNRVGRDGRGHDHCGSSGLYDPQGRCVARLAHQEGVLLGEVDADTVQRARERFGALRDRRPDLYRDLATE